MNCKIFIGLLVTFALLNVSESKPRSIQSIENSINSLEEFDNIVYRQKYAEQMLSYMNLSVEPCDDFYEYACGNWKNTIEERQCEKHRVNFLDINYKILDFVDEILQRSDINDVAPEYAKEFEMAKKFYKKCLDAELNSVQKSSDYLDIINKIGGFPAVNTEWNASQFNWINMSAHLSNYGIDNLINEQHIHRYPFIPIFPLPSFGFGIELKSDTISNASSIEYQLNRKRMTEILQVYGVTDEQQRDYIIGNIFKALGEVLGLLKSFKGNQEVCEEITRENFNDEDWDALNKEWMPYLQIAWKGKLFKLNENTGPCLYFHHEFNKIAETHKREIANYLALKFIYHMNANLEDPKFQQDYCASSVKNAMQFFFDHLYMKIHFKSDVSDDVSRMLKKIQESLQKILESADWLDEETREAAMLKNGAIGMHVGRYENPEVMKRILEQLNSLEYVDGSYEANKINLQKFSTYMQRYFGLHSEDYDESTKPMLLMLGTEINGFFFLLDNNMYISAAMLQPPEYHKSWPRSLKYGSLGFILGHELTHGFDITGSQFDHMGEYNNWWSEESAKVFKQRADCFVEFYSNYTIPEINRNIRGDLTQDENIADAGALHLALMAYRQYSSEQAKKFDSIEEFTKSERMPSIDATPEQLFFLGAAQLWCASFKQADYWRELTDYHTIDKYRVWGMMSNNKDFAKAYNCPLGSKMNQFENKCELW